MSPCLTTAEAVDDLRHRTAATALTWGAHLQGQTPVAEAVVALRRAGLA
jgi:hypothetical protein